MGVDYLARKTAKKRNKRAARDGAKDDKGVARDRKKKVTPKRRAGVCYGQPVVTLEDKRVTDDEDSDGNAGEEHYDVLAGANLNLEAEAAAGRESNRTKRLRSAVPIKKCGQFEKGAPNAKADAREKKRDLQKMQEADYAAGKVKLSTSISLGRPAPAPVSPTSAGSEKKDAQGKDAQGKDAQGKAQGKAPNKKRHAASDAEGVKAGQEGEDGVIAMEGDSATAQDDKVTAEALLPYHHVIRTYMAMQKFVEPTEVQAKTWPAACEGKDILAKAQPGAGKTLAFLLPLAAQLVEAGHGRHTEPAGPLVIMLAPTRELALQTHIACKPLMPLYGLRSTCIYGGVDKEAQVDALRRRPHLLVATPGRLLDMMDDMAIDLRHARAVVLDEADKMLSLGFAAQLDRLHTVLMLPRISLRDSAIVLDADADGKRAQKKAKTQDTQLVPAAASDADLWRRPQAMLLSATMPESAVEEAGRWLGSERVQVTIEASPLSISTTITQIVQVCAEHKKPLKLLKHLEAIKAASKGERSVPRVLVFCNRIKTVRFVFTELKKAEYKAVMLHGDRSQIERDAAVRDFKAGKAQILVATDVAARGLHVKNLPYIVNYDFPGNLETYIHRVGRTGRLQAYGHAFTFLTRNLARIAPDLVACLKEHDQSLDPNLVQLADAYSVVLAKLGPEALAKSEAAAAEAKAGQEGSGDDEDDEEAEAEEAVMLADDICEGLSSVAAGQVAASGAVVPKGRSSGRGARSSSEGIEGNSAVGLLPPLNAVQREKPAFVASKRFSGRRAGYVFTKGPKGLGFYLDKRAAPASAPAKKLKASAQRGAVQATPVVSAAKKSQLAGKPAAATPAASKPAAGKPAESKGKKRTSPYDEDDDEMVGSVPERAASKGKAGREQEASAPHAAAKGGKAGGKAKKIASPYDDDDDLIGSLPGRLSKGILSQASAGQARGTNGVGKKKAIPGRLRKKLQKMKADAA